MSFILSMTRRLPWIISCGAILSILWVTTGLHAQETAPTITVQQTSEISGVLGRWSISRPDNTKKGSSKELNTVDKVVPGRYSFFVDPPESSTTNITVIRNDIEEKTSVVPQVTFEAQEGDNILIITHYTFPRTGDAIVNSDPSGLNFTLSGPNNQEFKGVTPQFYQSVPVGQYSVVYEQIDGCTLPPRKSILIEENGRAEFNLNLQCDLADEMRQEEKQNTLPDFVSVRHNLRDVTLHDVAVTTWYAPYVKIAADREIMSGSKDANGELTGEFNPGGNVSIAQLLKIAHEVANVDENAMRGGPENTAARNQWFEAYMNSCEKRGWQVCLNRSENPGRNATRAEVVATLVQAFNIPRIWPTGTVFTDVKFSTRYASSIETGVTEGLIEGLKDENGTLTGAFAPKAPITRAEISKIVAKALELYVLVGE